MGLVLLAALQRRRRGIHISSMLRPDEVSRSFYMIPFVVDFDNVTIPRANHEIRSVRHVHAGSSLKEPNHAKLSMCFFCDMHHM